MIGPITSLTKFPIAFRCNTNPLANVTTRVHHFACASNKFNFLGSILSTILTVGVIVIAACTANAAIHNNSQPPMGSIMLKCAGILLALFATYLTFVGTAATFSSLGFGHAVANLTACIPSAYLLYFSFSDP